MTRLLIVALVAVLAVTGLACSARQDFNWQGLDVDPPRIACAKNCTQAGGSCYSRCNWWMLLVIPIWLPPWGGCRDDCRREEQLCYSYCNADPGSFGTH